MREPFQTAVKAAQMQAAQSILSVQEFFVATGVEQGLEGGEEEEMKSTSRTVQDSPAAFSELFFGNSPSTALSQSSSSSSLSAPLEDTLPAINMAALTQLAREQASRIRELEVVNVDLVKELDRITRSKDQLIGALQMDVQKWHTEARDKSLGFSAIQGKADQLDVISVEKESLKRELEDLRLERDNLLVRLEKSNSEAANSQRNSKLEMNTASLEIARLKLELESWTEGNKQSTVEQLEMGFTGKEKSQLQEQLQRERADATEQSAKLVRALDDLTQAERREALMQAEISSLRRRASDLEAYERASSVSMERLDAELQQVTAENSILRGKMLVVGSGGQRGTYLDGPGGTNNAAVSSGPIPFPRETVPEKGIAHTTSTAHTLPENPPRGNLSVTAPRLLSGAALQGPHKSLVVGIPHQPIPGSTQSLPQPPSPQHRKIKSVFREEENRAQALSLHLPTTTRQEPLQREPPSYHEISGPPANSFTREGLVAKVAIPLPVPPVRPPSSAPFATESSSAALAKTYEAAEKALTTLITEKNSLREEGARYV